ELGSLLQLADAFNRLFFERKPGPSGAYRLAASWFPAPRLGSTPSWNCAAPEGTNGVARGLCGVIADADGTGHRLAPLLRDDGVVIYGAKTGTIDALRDVAENVAACEGFNHARTPAGASAADQKRYWLACGKGKQKDINDSLF